MKLIAINCFFETKENAIEAVPSGKSARNSEGEGYVLGRLVPTGNFVVNLTTTMAMGRDDQL